MDLFSYFKILQALLEFPSNYQLILYHIFHRLAVHILLPLNLLYNILGNSEGHHTNDSTKYLRHFSANHHQQYHVKDF